MKTYAIVSKQDEKSIELSNKMRIELDTFMTYDEAHPELVISVGGDGTMIYSVHKYIHQLDEVSFIGIHSGTLGFLTDYQKDEYLELIEDIRQGEYHIYNRCLLSVKMGDVSYMALNEVRLENNRRSQVLGVYINGDFLETFRGNGLCVSTASGSTAYNKSLGGAVINSGAGLMQLTEIAGIHHNAYRSLGSSLILDESQTIKLEGNQFKHALIGIDHIHLQMDDVESIEVTIGKRYVNFIEYKEMSFIKRVRRAFINS